jgi:hypothetical protein
MFARYYRARHGGGDSNHAQKADKAKKKMKPDPMKKFKCQPAPADKKKRKSSHDTDDEQVKVQPPSKKAKSAEPPVKDEVRFCRGVP